MMKKTILTILLAFALPPAAFAADGTASPTVLSALWTTALLTAVIHTVAGPDHYLPFIAIAKSRGYGLKKTLLWTFVCGLGHIASALLIALAFIYFSHWLSEENFNWIEENRGNVAAYALIGLGGAYLLWALRHRLLHKHGAEHEHVGLPENDKNMTVWVLFIIFVLGPCEALLPILTASSVLGASAVVSCTILFSVATIATMMLAVAGGLLGLKAFDFGKLGNYAHEIAGGTIMACGLAIIFGL